ncbi:MAG: DHA2 family efflux MFS transporter permease subunit [Deltaproteobacteria bacterium]|nr:DHA2 family efflux MFS transporter permease subunit [Deltaproteobacteria bacterium]
MVIIGSFMAILDNNIVNVALPKMMANFGTTLEQIEWVVTGYMIAFAIAMPATIWLREVFGLKKVFMASLVFFCFGSALCGLAWDKDSLIVFRVIQAIGGGTIMPTGLTLVTEAFPPQERGMAMGIWSIGAMVAPAVGPFMGGYLVDEVSWRSIFYINLPVGGVALLATFWILSPGKGIGRARKFDLIGFSSFSLFLAALLIALAQGQREGWDSDYILACFGLSLLGLGVFIISGLRVENPIIDLGLFSNPNFLMASIINFVRAVAIFGAMFLLPLFLQNILDYKALETGIILAPTAISVAIVSPFSGLISDRIGPRIPLFSGTVLVAYSLYLYKDLSLNSDYWFLCWPQIIRGVGMGLINAPLMSSALNAVRREETSMASSLLTITLQVGGAFGVAVLGAMLQRREFFHYAHFLEQMNDPFSPYFSRAQTVMEGLMMKFGYDIPRQMPYSIKKPCWPYGFINKLRLAPLEMLLFLPPGSWVSGFFPLC